MTGFEYGVDGPKLIVVGLDGSDSSWRAAAYAAGSARRQRSKLVLVYVQTLGAGAFAQASGVLYDSGTQAADDLLGEIKAHVLRFGEQEHVTWEFRTFRGDPATGLAAVADELRADAIVVGTSERAGHRIFGSVAVRLVKLGRWPVTVVP
ncbi:universal stress protein [Rhodococcoides corynebacterioides]|uniref:universal stress protein n=1 Tax=Rhodococcoides corynebacterioides TaxID=53972 RepID=UPI000833A786|nr:universal stress protein [Rhodococcus corynebacterioides]